MRKKLAILLTVIMTLAFLTGCSSDKIVTLDDEFYGSSDFIMLTADELNDLSDSESNYVVYTYNNNCTMVININDILDKYMEKYQVSFYKIPFDEFKETFLHDEVEYAPSVIIVSNGKIVKYLDAESDDDLDCFKRYDSFKEWMETYVDIERTGSEE